MYVGRYVGIYGRDTRQDTSAEQVQIKGVGTLWIWVVDRRPNGILRRWVVSRPDYYPISRIRGLISKGVVSLGCIGLGIIGWAGRYTSCGVGPVTSGNVEV